MRVGVPKEIKNHEYRVGLVPAGVRELVAAGHQVLVQSSAGAGIGVDDAAWDHSVFSKNRDRLLEGDIASKFLGAVLAQPKVKKLLSSDHFSVDGTLIEAWASMKSVKPKDGSGRPRAADATPRRTSTARSGRTTRMPRPPTRMLAWRGSPTARRPIWRSPGTC